MQYAAPLQHHGNERDRFIADQDIINRKIFIHKRELGEPHQKHILHVKQFIGHCFSIIDGCLEAMDFV